MADQEDYGDVDEGLAERIREAAKTARAPDPAPGDLERHQRAEQRWQARLAALRLWERVTRAVWGFML